MKIHIDRDSNVPISHQISEQIVMSIATGVLKPGDTLQSVRELERQLGVSANTVSAAYKYLVERFYIARHRGRKMVVRRLDELPATPREDLDGLIDAAIRAARGRGYSLQNFRKRVRERLLIEPPDHVLIVEEEPGMRRLLQLEITGSAQCAVVVMSPEELAGDDAAVIGALVVSLPGRAQGVLQLLPKRHPFLVLEPCSIEAHVKMIRELKRASVIAVASISPVLLETARPLLAPFVGRFHAFEEHDLHENERKDLSGMDLVFCDSISRASIKARRSVHYRLISDATIQEIKDVVSAPA